MPFLTGRVAIITGASRGIGRAITLSLVRQGCPVVIAAKSTQPSDSLPGSIYSVAQEVAALGGQALPLQVDVRDAEQIDGMASRTLERFGGIDIPINNTGALWWKPLVEMPAKRFD